MAFDAKITQRPSRSSIPDFDLSHIGQVGFSVFSETDISRALSAFDETCFVRVDELFAAMKSELLMPGYLSNANYYVGDEKAISKHLTDPIEFPRLCRNLSDGFTTAVLAKGVQTKFNATSRVVLIDPQLFKQIIDARFSKSNSPERQKQKFRNSAQAIVTKALINATDEHTPLHFADFNDVISRQAIDVLRARGRYVNVSMFAGEKPVENLLGHFAFAHGVDIYGLDSQIVASRAPKGRFDVFDISALQEFAQAHGLVVDDLQNTVSRHDADFPALEMRMAA